MSEKIDIRRLTDKDLNTFFNIRLEALLNAPESFLNSYEEEKAGGITFYAKAIMQNNDNNLIFGAFIKEQLIGVAGIYIEEKQKLQHTANIWGTYVHPNYRSQGVAKALMKKAIMHAKMHMNIITIKISVEATNVRAIKLYESFGFKTWGIEKKAIKIDDKFYDELHMALHLED